MWYMSSAVSPIELSVRITKFPVSLDVWEEREDDECRTVPNIFNGLQKYIVKRSSNIFVNLCFNQENSLLKMQNNYFHLKL